MSERNEADLRVGPFMITVELAGNEHLEQIVDLWSPNRSTLGFFPVGAFEDAVNNRRVLVALHDKSVVGYVIFRATQDRASIVHFCVHPLYRAKGTSQALFEGLLATIPKKCKSIWLRCRQEFAHAQRLWERLKFSLIYQVPGRGEDGGVLNVWRLNLGMEPDLFTAHYEEIAARLPLAILDTNVVISWHAGDDPEVNGLKADWLELEVCLGVTPEVNNEIARNPDPVERGRLQKFIRSFKEFDPTFHEKTQANTSLQPLFGECVGTQNLSDFRQVENAAAVNADFFVTSDNGLLGRADEIALRCGLQVVRPSDLVRHVDRMRQTAVYEPSRLVGSGLEIRRPDTNTSDDALSDAFAAGEKKSHFLKRVRELRAHPQTSMLDLVTNAITKPVGIAGAKLTEDGIKVDLTIVRTAPGRLSRTIRHVLIEQVIKWALKRNARFVEAVETCGVDDFHRDLGDHGFLRHGNRMVRHLGTGVVPFAQALRQINEQAIQAGLIDHQGRVISTEGIEDAEKLKVEMNFWPMKFQGLEVPCYIVPIQGRWASQLFDHGLANQMLFPAVDSLALSRLNVYYKSTRPILEGPGRVLWYVSKKGNFDGAGMIRACSYLLKVEVGTPKTLFRKHQHLGVYSWEDVLKTAKDDVDGTILSFTFGDTECFKSGIPYEMANDVLVGHGHGMSTFPSALRIKTHCFETLYNIGSTRE